MASRREPDSVLVLYRRGWSSIQRSVKRSSSAASDRRRTCSRAGTDSGSRRQRDGFAARSATSACAVRFCAAARRQHHRRWAAQPTHASRIGDRGGRHRLAKTDAKQNAAARVDRRDARAKLRVACGKNGVVCCRRVFRRRAAPVTRARRLVALVVVALHRRRDAVRRRPWRRRPGVVWMAPVAVARGCLRCAACYARRARRTLARRRRIAARLCRHARRRTDDALLRTGATAPARNDAVYRGA